MAILADESNLFELEIAYQVKIRISLERLNKEQEHASVFMFQKHRLFHRQEPALDQYVTAYESETKKFLFSSAEEAYEFYAAKCLQAVNLFAGRKTFWDQGT